MSAAKQFGPVGVQRSQSPPPSYDSHMFGSGFSQEHAQKFLTAMSKRKAHSNANFDVTVSSAAGSLADAMSRRSVTLSCASEDLRQELYIALVRTFASAGASLNEVEDMMLMAARAFTMETTLVRMGKSVTCMVGPRTNWNLKVKFTEYPDGSRDHSLIREVRDVLDEVISEDLTVAEALYELARNQRTATRTTGYAHILAHTIIAGLVSATVFAVLQENSMDNAYIPALGAVILSIAHTVLRSYSQNHAQLFQAFAAAMIALISHDTIHHSAPITSILPGFMYMCSAFQSSDGDLPSEIVNMTFWIPYTLMLGLGLHITLDVVLMYNLLMLVLLVQDTVDDLRQFSGRNNNIAPVRRGSYAHYTSSSSLLPSPGLLSPPSVDTSLLARIHSLHA